MKMRLLNQCCLLLLAAVGIASCQKKDIAHYDTATNYISFDIPYQTNNYGEETEYRLDSLSYSFALDDLEITDTVINVVVKTIGVPADVDRAYVVEVVQEETTATADDWDSSILDGRFIPAGELTDTIRIEIHRNAALQEEWHQIYLRVVPNENFQLGYANLETVKISFSDIMIRPEWWTTWEGEFGPFYREVYLKWIELYPLGADPGTNADNGQPLYWGNMPMSYYYGQYPVLMMYIQQLKEYFKMNTIYPDGDTSRQPIRLPE